MAAVGWRPLKNIAGWSQGEALRPYKWAHLENIGDVLSSAFLGVDSQSSLDFEGNSSAGLYSSNRTCSCKRGGWAQ